MNTWKKLLIISGMCSLAGVTPAFASTNLETGSSLAGISVALNNYYAGNAAGVILQSVGGNRNEKKQ